MTSTPEQARTTAVDSLKPAGASRTRQNFDPTRLFVQRDRLPWIWFFLAVATVVFAAFDRWHLVNSFKRRECVVIIDPVVQLASSGAPFSIADGRRDAQPEPFREGRHSRVPLAGPSRDRSTSSIGTVMLS